MAFLEVADRLATLLSVASDENLVGLEMKRALNTARRRLIREVVRQRHRERPFMSEVSEAENLSAERKASLKEAFKKISTEDAQVISMYLEGKTVPAIAAALGLSTRTAFRRLQHATHTIRAMIGR